MASGPVVGANECGGTIPGANFELPSMCILSLFQVSICIGEPESVVGDSTSCAKPGGAMCSVLRYSPPFPSENMAEDGNPLEVVCVSGIHTCHVPTLVYRKVRRSVLTIGQNKGGLCCKEKGEKTEEKKKEK